MTLPAIFRIQKLPLEIYRLQDDGRQWRHLCVQRQQLAWMLAGRADKDGGSIMVSVGTMCRQLGIASRQTVHSLLDNLSSLGFHERLGKSRFKGTQVRRLNLEAMVRAAERLEATVQSSHPTVQSTPSNCPILEGKDSKIGHNLPSSDLPIHTHPHTHPTPPAPTTGAGTLGACVCVSDSKPNPLAAEQGQQVSPSDADPLKWVEAIFNKQTNRLPGWKKGEKKKFLALIEKHGMDKVKAAWRKYVVDGYGVDYDFTNDVTGRPVTPFLDNAESRIEKIAADAKRKEAFRIEEQGRTSRGIETRQNGA